MEANDEVRPLHKTKDEKSIIEANIRVRIGHSLRKQRQKEVRDESTVLAS